MFYNQLMQEKLFSRRDWINRSLITAAGAGTLACLGKIGTEVLEVCRETTKHEKYLLDTALKVTEVHNKFYDGHGIAIDFEFLKPGLFELSFRESNVVMSDPSKFGAEIKFRIVKTESNSESYERSVDEDQYVQVENSEFKEFLYSLKNHQHFKFQIEASYKKEENNGKILKGTILF